MAATWCHAPYAASTAAHAVQMKMSERCCCPPTPSILFPSPCLLPLASKVGARHHHRELAGQVHRSHRAISSSTACQAPPLVGLPPWPDSLTVWVLSRALDNFSSATILIGAPSSFGLSWPALLRPSLSHLASVLGSLECVDGETLDGWSD
jgi:hypothetical protein